MVVGRVLFFKGQEGLLKEVTFEQGHGKREGKRQPEWKSAFLFLKR